MFQPPEDRMDAKISYNPSLDEILCEITSLGRYGQPNILVGNCASFPECQLKFEPLWPSVFSSGYELLSGQFEEIKSSESTPYRSFATKFSQGYLECSGNYRGEFLSNIDYFFTGLDNRKYLMSDPFPQEGIIKMSTKLEQPVRVGTRYSVDCKISTFVLLPNIQFVLGFENGNETLVSVTSQTPETIIENTDAITNTSTIIWKLHVTIKAGLNKITCYAPRINSSKWAQSEINIKVATDQVIPEMNSNASTSFGFNEPEQLHPKINLTDSTRPGVNVNDATALVYEYVKIGGGIAGVIVILIVLLIIYVATRRRVASFRKIFYIIRRVIVLNLSPEEVKEFLDLKTENKFLGAVVDDLAEGKCLGVIELSRFGNLNNYLRKSSTQPSVDYKNIDEMELQGTLPLPVLLHFCTQIAKGMDFIEQKNVIHGDLATRNVLVFEKHVVKITDFGLSRKLYTRSNYTKKSKVPLPWAWMALESLCFNEYSPKTDVWSFGVTVWEILSKGPTPYSGTAWTPDFADQVEAGLRLTKPGLAPDNVYNFMMTCWENKPQNRPTFTECVQFFSSLEPKLQRN
ncbi:unnamed protein product [Allacma fusca]|uniref:Protein kinase domain-containing protein n=1 Tax=Allacma fusca TaxID=39272 RepID=A0A8J2PCS7_9HEXA|nr:unnamed protein product [Allacma fusca]